tara:strand:- start:428 stop:1528 length:1101 start_codon:yes stop_codon:yes gene_type:complete
MYSAITPTQETASRAAMLRRKRLNKISNNWLLGVSMDLLFGAGPWVFGMLAICAGLVSIYDEVDAAPATFLLFNAPAAIGALSTFAGFLLVTRQSTNLGNNAKIIGEFGNMSGSLVNICLFLKSQISTGKTVDFISLSDGDGGYFQTTRIALACSTIMYVVKYTGRGTTIVPEGLPLGQDARLLKTYYTLTSPANGSPGMSPFSACLLIVGELVDDFQIGEKASEYAVLFGQINAVTAAEGGIGGTAGYGQPYLMKWLLIILYTIYLFFIAITDLVPNNRWNSLWIGAVIAFCTISFYQISDRYGNPMKLRSSRAGQKPFISMACVDTEIAITSIFSRSRSVLLGGNNAGIETSASFSPMTFKLRS